MLLDHQRRAEAGTSALLSRQRYQRRQRQRCQSRQLQRDQRRQLQRWYVRTYLSTSEGSGTTRAVRVVLNNCYRRQPHIEGLEGDSRETKPEVEEALLVGREHRMN